MCERVEKQTQSVMERLSFVCVVREIERVKHGEKRKSLRYPLSPLPPYIGSWTTKIQIEKQITCSDDHADLSVPSSQMTREPVISKFKHLYVDPQFEADALERVTKPRYHRYGPASAKALTYTGTVDQDCHFLPEGYTRLSM